MRLYQRLKTPEGDYKDAYTLAHLTMHQSYSAKDVLEWGADKKYSARVNKILDALHVKVLEARLSDSIKAKHLATFHGYNEKSETKVTHSGTIGISAILSEIDGKSTGLPSSEE